MTGHARINVLRSTRPIAYFERPADGDVPALVLVLLPKIVAYRARAEITRREGALVDQTAEESAFVTGIEIAGTGIFSKQQIDTMFYLHTD